MIAGRFWLTRCESISTARRANSPSTTRRARWRPPCLQQIAARKAKYAERAAARKAQEAAETKPPAPPVPLPELAPVATQPEPALAQATPEPELPQARKLLTLGPAAKDALAKRALGTTEVVATIERRAR